MTYLIDLQCIKRFTTVSLILKNCEIKVQTGCKRFTEMKRYRYRKVKRLVWVKKLVFSRLLYSLTRIFNAFETANQPDLKQKQPFEHVNAMCKKCSSVSLSITPLIFSPNAENGGFSAGQISKPVK